jgi:sugar lactone lactonase YvrE
MSVHLHLPRPRARHVFALALLALSAVPWSVAPLDAQAVKPLQAHVAPARAQWGSGPAAVATASGLVPVQEQEPNNSAATATPVNLGDDAIGVIDPAGDTDWFSVQLVAGVPIELEVVAMRVGSQLDSYLRLFAPDGSTLVAQNDDALELDSRIRYTPPTTGRYYFMVTDFFGSGSAAHTYRILVRQVTPAPGDPTTVLAGGLPFPWTAAAGPGVLYVLLDTEIRRVTLTGGMSVFASGMQGARDLVVDGEGNVVVAEMTGPGGGRVTRIHPNGTPTQIVSGLQSAVALTIGPDGSLWVADPAAQRLHRFPPFGGTPTSVNIGPIGGGLMNLAFSPAGDLHMSDYAGTIYRLVNGVLSHVIQLEGAGGIAFDRDGYLYVGTISDGIVLYDPQYAVLHLPFARDGMELTASLVFARDATGAMTSRLFGVNRAQGTIREVNAASVRAPGFRVGIDVLSIATASLRAGIMGAVYADTLRLQDGAPAAWSVASGALPAGLTLNTTTGVLTGIPAGSGAFVFTIRAQADGRIGERTYNLAVTRPVVDAAAAANHLLGMTGQLSEDVLRFLDLQGNGNGRFDIGDLQAFLRTRPGAIPFDQN